jgi:Ca-activated chloride channel homolog
MNALSFGEPVFAGLAACFLLFAWWLLARSERQRREALEQFGDEKLLAHSSAIPAAKRRRLGLGLRVAAVVLGLLALARPQLGTEPASLAHRGRDVLVALDLSRSMNAADVAQSNGPPLSRLAAAKAAVLSAVRAGAGDRLGLIIFGGSAFLQLPLSADHAAFQRFLEAATSDDLGDPATNLSTAILTAATTFEHEGEQGYESVLLVSDGESGAGDVGPALGRLHRRGVPVFALGVGTLEGAPVPADSSEAPEQWHRDHIGRVVISQLDEGDLRRAARETNGSYLRLQPGALPQITAEMSRLEKRTVSAHQAVQRADRFQWPLALGVLALVLSPVVSGVPRRRR